MKSTFKVLGSIALLAIAVFLTAACDLDDAPVTGITLDKSNVNLAVGGKSSIKATIKPDNAKDKGINWSSSNPLVVSVTSKGVITGEAIGTAEITAETKDGGFTAKCAVTVSADGGGNVSLGATLSISNVQVYTPSVITVGEEYEYVPFTGSATGLNYVPVIKSDGPEYLPLNEVFDGTNSVTITSGKLSIKLGTPKASALISINETGIPASLKVSNRNAKLFLLYGITDNDRQSLQGDEVIYIYTDRDLTISGTVTDEYSTELYDWKFKKSWNAIFVDSHESGDKRETTLKSGTPTGNEKWFYGGDDVVIEPEPIPIASDFNIFGLNQVYNGSAKYVNITPKAGKSPGSITVYYDGSMIAPSAIGVYAVTFDVAAAPGWKSVEGLYAGLMWIESSGGEGGTLTFTGIPSKYNGKYAFFQTYDESESDTPMGFESFNLNSSTITLSPISNGSASFPVWKDIDERYYGNGSYDTIRVFIFDSQIINVQDGIGFLSTAIWLSGSSVNFSNGNASMSWNQGEEEDINGGAPSAPTGVMAERDSSNPSTVYISWNYVSEASYYEIYYSYSSNESGGKDGQSYTTSFTSRDNSTNSTVYFRVFAVNSEGQRSAPSSWVSVAPVSGGGDDGFLGATLSISDEQVYTTIYDDEEGIAIGYAPFNDTLPGIYSVYVPDEEVDENYIPLNDIMDGASTVTLINGILSVNLGTPNASAMTSILDGLEAEDSNITVSPNDVKWFSLNEIRKIDIDYTYRLSLYDETETSGEAVMFIYSDKNATISGTNVWYDDREGFISTFVYAIDLKTGWNSVIITGTSINSYTYEYTYRNGKPSANVKWFLYSWENRP